MRLMDLFRKKSSGEVAKDRLKLLLVSDRANCSPERNRLKMISSRSFPNIWILTPRDWISRSPKRNPKPATAWFLRCLQIFRLRICITGPENNKIGKRNVRRQAHIEKRLIYGCRSHK